MIQEAKLSKLSPILCCMETNCARKGPRRAQHHLTHPAAVYSHLCALVGFITPGSTVVHTISPRAGAFYSPASVSDILTRSHKRVTGERKEDKMPESSTLPTRDSKRPLWRPRSHTIMSLQLIMHTPSHACTHLVIFITVYQLCINNSQHTCTPARRPTGPVIAAASRKLMRLAGFV